MYYCISFLRHFMRPKIWDKFFFKKKSKSTVFTVHMYFIENHRLTMFYYKGNKNVNIYLQHRYDLQSVQPQVYHVIYGNHSHPLHGSPSLARGQGLYHKPYHCLHHRLLNQQFSLISDHF